MDGEPFHLIGMSMGGALAGLYAAEYPEHIHCLTLMCPASKLCSFHLPRPNTHLSPKCLPLMKSVFFKDSLWLTGCIMFRATNLVHINYWDNRLLDSLVVECWHRVREVPGSIPSQGLRHTKHVIKNGTSSALV